MLKLIREVTSEVPELVIAFGILTFGGCLLFLAILVSCGAL
jgi:hypothetical protein